MRVISHYTNRKTVRERVRRLILNTIKKTGSISQNDICLNTGVRPATVINCLAELKKEGYVRESGPGKSSGGRPPRLLEINPASHCVIGLHYDGAKLRGVVTDLNGEISAQAERPTPAAWLRSSGADQTLRTNVIDWWANLISRLINKIGNKRRILGIGLGVPGLVDQAHGTGIFYADLPWWKDILFKPCLEKQFSLNVKVENDTKVLTLAEKWYGQGKGVSNFLLLDTGIGIALGIFLDNKLYRGSGQAGEFGHTTIAIDGPLCRCGRRGCLEAMASSSVLQREAGNLPLSAIIEKANAGDAHLLEIISRTGRYLGSGIVNLINIFNPSLIILGGELAQAGDLIVAPIKKVVREETLRLSREVAMVTSRLGPLAGARGAATLILEGIFDAD